MNVRLLIACIVLFSACEDVNESPVSRIMYSDNVDRISLSGKNSTDAEGNTLSYQWSTKSSVITIANPFSSETYFMIPAGADAKTAELSLIVSDGSSQSVTTQSITIPGFSSIRYYGIGKTLGDEASNDRVYDWYLDQMNSGTHASVNCGPASVTMAIKWFNENFSGTMEDARNTYRQEGGWWYTDDIIGYLSSHNVNNFTIDLNDVNKLRTEIDNDNIAILCLDMDKVSYNDVPEHRAGKFYKTNPNWGHFIVIKGYKEVDGVFYYEAYDPYSYSKSYLDGNLKGKNRYYTSADLAQATAMWWHYAIIISKDEQGGRRAGIDTEKIAHMPGR